MILSIPYKARQLFISPFPELWFLKQNAFTTLWKALTRLGNDPVMLQNTTGSMFIYLQAFWKDWHFL